MNYPHALRLAAALAALGAGAAFAQATGPTATDVAPPPAESRESTGAVVLDGSLVRAQREGDFERSSKRTGVTSVGKGAVKKAMKAPPGPDTAQAREAELLDLHRMGAGSATGR